MKHLRRLTHTHRACWSLLENGPEWQGVMQTVCQKAR